MTEMIAAAELPPIFIEEFLDGFIAAERDGALLACGGVEMYGDCAVIRSVVVDPGARGLGLGGQLAERLMAQACKSGATDLYLFTADAWEFWKRYGFVDVTFEEWREPARACWQYQFLSQNREMVSGIHTMWRAAADR
jgi:N-acetylglutamate synthase-like GNAT family acetyltransferase